MAGWPVARTPLPDGGALLVHRGRALDERAAAAPGTVLRTASELAVACGDGGVLALEEVQREGRARLAAADFLRGVRWSAGARLGGYPGAQESRP
jgi:methionyl-tRNA formyltransferase